MLWQKKQHRIDFHQNWLVRLSRRFLPIADTYHGSNFFVRLKDGRRILTPLALVLVVIEATDVVFAVDSIPAIFGITHDPFIVYTSNICAVLGLRSSPSRLSSDLEALHARVQGKSLTVEKLKQALKGRGTAMLLVVLALPFCFVAIPGLSTPFGIAISLIGARC